MNFRARYRLIGAIVLLAMMMHFSIAFGQDTDPPVITLNAPADEAVTTNQYMQLSTTVNDASPPMSVWIYGGTATNPQTLLLADTNVSDDATLTFDWNATRLTSGTGTMGLWHFDNYAGTTVYDSSGNSNDGSFGGNASWTWDGRFGYAIDFDGTLSGLSIPDHASLDIDSAEGTLTMEAWINPNTVSNGYATIIAKRAGSSTNYQISLNSTSDDLLFYSGHWPQVFISDVSIPIDTWSYIAVTVDVTGSTGEAIFYLNGAPADTISGDTVVFGGANDVPLMIGSIDGEAQPFDGMLDEVRLTDHVLSASEIAANYELGNGEYYWKVVAEDDEDNSATSSTWSFTVGDVSPPDIPDLYDPATGIYVTTNTPTFEWENTAGTGGTYTLQYAQDVSFSTGLVTVTDLTTTVYTPSTGLAEGDWYWHVQAHNAGGASGYQTTAFSFTVDTQAPSAPTGLTIEPGHEKCKLSWTNPGEADFAGVVIRRNPWGVGAYPEYSDGGAALGYPTDETDGDPVYQGTAESYLDSSDTGAMPRNVYYYSIFAYDLAGNYSVATSAQQGRATNYWLSDVTGDGNVYNEDLTVFSNTYWTSDGDGNYNNFFDVGPTYSGGPRDIPQTDDDINFEDLVILAINFDLVDPNMKVAPIFANERVSGPLELFLESPSDELKVGQEFSVRVLLKNNPGTVKSIHFTIPYDADDLELIGVSKSHQLENAPCPVFFASRNMDRYADVNLAVLGGDVAIGGSGEISTLTFRLLKADDVLLGFDLVDLRDSENRKLLDAGDNDVIPNIPSGYELSRNYPNPFNMQTQISYQLPMAGEVSLKIYNIQGQAVRTLVNRLMPAGSHKVMWDGRNDMGYEVASGIYFYQLRSDEFQIIRKMVLLK